eukprot:maker-scaffold334_size202906-snap-gene-1.31 protein:Tk08970 transcript:maker-scaffold334_size202906-snap-gene-1.31-mRNA-1 annotation:"dynactin subunit 2"
MTAVDPKYAQLPGIAVDQPDHYETTGSGLTEADQAWAQDSSDAIEVLHISTNEAFGLFKGKTLDGQGVDFSDRLKNTKYRQGYVAWSGDYEVDPEAKDETLMQKYQRLNCEVRELVEELESAKDKDEAKKDQSQSLDVLVHQVQGLNEELASLNLEERLGRDTLKGLYDPEGLASAKMLAHLAALQTGTRSQANRSGEKSVDSSSVIYELLMKPDTAKLEHLERIAHMDKRLESLERTIGAAPEQMSTLSMETNQKSVLGAIQVLSKRTALLEPAHLDHVEGRLAALQSKMNSIAERKPILADQAKQSKIDELYDMVHRSVGQTQMLEEVVERLEALQDLHGRAQSFDQTLAELEEVQSKIGNNLANNQSLLKATQDKFKENLTNIQENFKVLDDRLTKMKQK